MGNKSIVRIRGGSGLGDALYVQGVCRYLVERGQKLEACTNFPEVFAQLPVQTAEFTRQNIDVIAHYSKGRQEEGSQWQDVCKLAGIPLGAELRLDWRPGEKWKRTLQEKRVLLVYAPRTPMDRKDGWGEELYPNEEVFAGILSTISPAFYTVLVGSGQPRFRPEVDLDLVNKTTVTDLIDIASLSSRLMGQVSGVIPLAESLNKKCLILWSSRGLQSTDWRISRLGPRKVISKDELINYVVDDWPQERIAETIIDFL